MQKYYDKASTISKMIDELLSELGKEKPSKEGYLAAGRFSNLLEGKAAQARGVSQMLEPSRAQIDDK